MRKPNQQSRFGKRPNFEKKIRPSLKFSQQRSRSPEQDSSDENPNRSKPRFGGNSRPEPYRRPKPTEEAPVMRTTTKVAVTTTTTTTTTTSTTMPTTERPRRPKRRPKFPKRPNFPKSRPKFQAEPMNDVQKIPLKLILFTDGQAKGLTDG